MNIQNWKRRNPQKLHGWLRLAVRAEYQSKKMAKIFGITTRQLERHFKEDIAAHHRIG
jgi:transcriptional regulator GlxA family with amidase domain